MKAKNKFLVYNNCMELNKLKGKIIVSVQAAKGEPLYDEVCINALLKSVVNGGASAVRVAGCRDVKNAKKLLNVPVIGLTKPEVMPEHPEKVVYITPTIKDIENLIDSGADIVAFDATLRKHDFDFSEALEIIHSKNRLAMADIATFNEGINCAKLGFDIISTTLSGYTQESIKDTDEPDFDLLENLTKTVDVPIFAEGRFWERNQVKKAFELNAHSVVIGSAITRPQLITKRFTNFGEV